MMIEIVYSAEDLHLACDALIQRTRVRIDEAWHNLPSLLEQLAGADAAAIGANGTGGAVTKAPINTGVVGLLVEIHEVSRRQLADLGQPDHRNDVSRNVRAATTASAITADADEMAAWLYQLNRWRHGARQELRLDSGRRQWLRGVPCPDCHASIATHLDSSNMPIQTSALSVTWSEPADGRAHVDDEWRWSAITCKACQATWWRGDTMQALIESLLAVGAIDPIAGVL